MYDGIRGVAAVPEADIRSGRKELEIILSQAPGACPLKHWLEIGELGLRATAYETDQSLSWRIKGEV